MPDHLAWWIAHDRFFFQRVAAEFKRGAEQLDRIAQQMHGRAFANCTPNEKDGVFGKLQSGSASTRGFDSERFLEQLLTFTVEGFLADPRYGGNRDQVGWKLIGFKPCWWAPRLPRLGAHHQHLGSP